MVQKTSNPAAWGADRARKSDRSGGLIGSEILALPVNFKIFVAAVAAIDPAALAALAALLVFVGEASQ